MGHRGAMATFDKGAGLSAPTFTQKANATKRVDGVSVGAVALGTAAYRRATVTARKPGANALTLDGANSGAVYVCGSATSLVGAITLDAGESAELPSNCSLADFFLAVDNEDDGVLITYVD